MRHKKRRYKLGRTTAHRKATLENLTASLFRHGRIQTTVTKAKAASRLADHLITLAKRADLHATRQIVARLKCRDLTRKLVKEIAPSAKERQGGYTRILRYKNRAGDGAQLVVWQLTDYIAPVKPDPGQKKKVKKEKTHAETHKETQEVKEKKRKEESPKAGEVRKEEAKPGRGGFLSGLRKFLTGESNPEGKSKSKE